MHIRRPYKEQEGDDRFSESIRAYLASLQRNVDRLTHEQYRVINMLREERRVRIRGCAGSGKTLVAAEKAIRLANAGVNTLFLCHNPLLAGFVMHLTRGSGVNVFAFETWVSILIDRHVYIDPETWTRYNEPDSSSVDCAFDALMDGEQKFDAIIVDEGQDFRDEWWTLVEAALEDLNSSTFYIFHDDNQSLLNRSVQYPIQSPTLDLSRNCRNASEIYRLMSDLNGNVPLPEEALHGGKVYLLEYGHKEEKDALKQSLEWLVRQGISSGIVLLQNGSEAVWSSTFGTRFAVPPVVNQPWQDEVISLFISMAARIKLEPDCYITAPPEKNIKVHLRNLSGASTPTVEDRELVRKVADQFKISAARLWKREQKSLVYRKLEWKIINAKYRLRSVEEGQESEEDLELYGSFVIQPEPPYYSIDELEYHEVIVFFQNIDWNHGILETRLLNLHPFNFRSKISEITIYDIATFKGLEADVVVLFLQGTRTRFSEALYVGISRARAVLIILADPSAIAQLPASWEFENFIPPEYDFDIQDSLTWNDLRFNS